MPRLFAKHGELPRAGLRAVLFDGWPDRAGTWRFAGLIRHDGCCIVNRA